MLELEKENAELKARLENTIKPTQNLYWVKQDYVWNKNREFELEKAYIVKGYIKCVKATVNYVDPKGNGISEKGFDCSLININKEYFTTKEQAEEKIKRNERRVKKLYNIL